MALEQIPEEEIRQTLLRAQEIAEQRPSMTGTDFEAFLKAAEETGIPREATLQALRERHLLPAAAPAPGDLVFAPSDDQHLYAASVTSVGESSASVRFVHGGEKTYAFADLAPATFMPERQIQYKYPGYGWVGAKVSRFDSTTRTVWLTSGWDWTEREVPLSQVRLPPPRPSSSSPLRTLLWRVALAAGVGGTLLGVLLDHLLR